MQKTKLNELLTFPCSFTYKVIGLAHARLIDQILEVVKRRIPGDYNPTLKLSSGSKYCSVSITIKAIHIEQVETLYKELGNLATVRMIL